ncbi:glutaminyl-tRNA synthetase [Hysterangium stoloniferum]|nr:glutaminyl-tRNA synthetase [Hysterangium stoloniferum]
MSPKTKFDPSDPVISAIISLFQSINLSQTKAVETARNSKNTSSLKELIDRNDLIAKELEEKQANSILQLAVQGTRIDLEQQDIIVTNIVNGKLKTSDQVTAAVKYLEEHPLPIDESHFNLDCGVGVVITPDQVDQLIVDYISACPIDSIAGWSNLSSVLSGAKNMPALRWANTFDVKTSVERWFAHKFGAKETAKSKQKDPKQPPADRRLGQDVQTPTTPSKAVFEQGFLGSLHKPGENPQINPRLRDQHLAVTGGQVWTRFPPEPNGFLHIGHSKAIFINFGYAAHHGGRCYLRYDDTNPEAEDAQYYESILEIVRWLGYEPWKVTYSSDYFQELYDLAVTLIRLDKGYVCHCTAEDIKASRGEKEGTPRRACIHRNRPISESLVEFENMKEGKYRRGEATLRMKQDLEDGNPQMWDLIAYRVVDAPHHRTGDKWRIYPTYDFTHCLVDSFENISHSLCTTEFILSRVSYEWLCDAVEVYKPRQSEFGRLNLQGTITSKRKILALVKDGYVRGWDDPRLFTLVALRRRGIPPAAILSFVESLGVSSSMSTVEVSRFDQAIRQHLENTVPRLMMVMRPLRVVIENLADDFVMFIDKPLHPKLPEVGTVRIPFTKIIYIDQDDFRVQDSKDYFRLAPGKTVGLFQAPFPITCTSYQADPSTGEVIGLTCRAEDGKDGTPLKKPKAFIQWVAEHAASNSPVRVDETRIFHPLFRSDNPAALPDYKDDLNPNSLEVVKNAFIEVGFWSMAKSSLNAGRQESITRTQKALNNEAIPLPTYPSTTGTQLVGNEAVRFQALRVAYFALDKESRLAYLDDTESANTGKQDGDILVLNRIVSLKEDSGKAV